MSFVVRNNHGLFLDQKRGQRCGWTTNLSKAQVFESAGRGRVAYNHATASARWSNERNARIRANYPDRNAPHIDIPTFEAVPVEVKLSIEIKE